MVSCSEIDFKIFQVNWISHATLWRPNNSSYKCFMSLKIERKLKGFIFSGCSNADSSKQIVEVLSPINSICYNFINAKIHILIEIQAAINIRSLLNPFISRTSVLNQLRGRKYFVVWALDSCQVVTDKIWLFLS